MLNLDTHVRYFAGYTVYGNLVDWAPSMQHVSMTMIDLSRLWEEKIEATAALVPTDGSGGSRAYIRWKET